MDGGIEIRYLSSESTKGAIFIHFNQFRYSLTTQSIPGFKTKFKEILGVNTNMKRIVLHALNFLTGIDDKGLRGCDSIISKAKEEQKLQTENSNMNATQFNYCD